ncbi:MAG: hypothetical protein RJA36_133 [Pseudomonadota bacterium]
MLFGASTPLSKWLVGGIHPVLLGGLLYLGSGIGLGVFRLARDRGWKSSGLQPVEWPWLLGAIGFGGVLGPVALMVGLTQAAGSTAALMLNLESVLTALLAWLVFKENADRRIVLGMAAIVAGGAVLSWPSGGGGIVHSAGSGGHCPGLSVLGHRQQPHAQGIGLGCHVHRQHQGADGGRGELRHREPPRVLRRPGVVSQAGMACSES